MYVTCMVHCTFKGWKIGRWEQKNKKNNEKESDGKSNGLGI